MIASRTLSLLATLPFLAPAANAWGEGQPEPDLDCINRRQPSSMLLFPYFDAGARGWTIHSITNTNTTPSGFGQVGGTTNVQFDYVTVIPSGDPFHPSGCFVVDRVETLTPADTLSVMAICHAPENTQGYLVVTAQDPLASKTDWSHNYLVGSELVISAGGGAYAINAIGIKSRVAEHAWTDVNPVDGLRNMNGFEYDPAPDRLILDSILPIGRQELVLLNLTGNGLARNTVKFDIWNDNEYPMSSTVDFNCWFENPLNIVSPVFDEEFLKNLPNDPDELDISCNGDTLETAWAFLDSINVSSDQGTVASDGAIFGALTGGIASEIRGGHLLWESCETQDNASLIAQ